MSQFKGNLNHFANFLEQYKKNVEVSGVGGPPLRTYFQTNL